MSSLYRRGEVRTVSREFGNCSSAWSPDVLSAVAEWEPPSDGISEPGVLTHTRPASVSPVPLMGFRPAGTRQLPRISDMAGVVSAVGTPPPLPSDPYPTYPSVETSATGVGVRRPHPGRV